MLLEELIEKAFCDGYEYAQREYSDKKKKKRLEDIESHRGLGRAAVIGALTGGGVLPSAIGGYAGKKYAEKLDREGASDGKIITGSARRAALVGGGINAVGGLGLMALAGKRDRKAAAAITALGTAGGALASAAGARRNSIDRINKRNRKDRD